MSYPDVRFAGGPTYLSGSDVLLFPFSFNRGVLDLPATFVSAQAAAAQAIVNAGGPESAQAAAAEPKNAGVFIRRLGGNSPVTVLGPNFLSYIRNTKWNNNGTIYSFASNAQVRITANGVVTKVQQLGLANLPSEVDAASYKVSTTVPTNFIQYASSYLFDAPLIVSATATSGAVVYITFYTQWDH